MARTVVRIQQSIYDKLDLCFRSGNCHYKPTTGEQRCSSAPTSHRSEAELLLLEFAHQSPLFTNQSSHIRSHIHGFSVIETFRRLASAVLCPVHGSPIVITQTLLTWLDTASSSSELFTLSTDLETSISDLHVILPYLVRDQTTDVIISEAADSWQDAPPTNLRRIILSALDSMFDSYFENFALAITDRVVEQLTGQRSLTNSMPGAWPTEDLGRSESAQVQSNVSQRQQENTSDSVIEEDTLTQDEAIFNVVQGSSAVHGQPTPPASPNHTVYPDFTTYRDHTSSSDTSPVSLRSSPFFPLPSPTTSTPPTNLNPPDTNADAEPSCPICFDPLNDPLSTSTPPRHPTCPTCRYQFHIGCFDQWTAHRVDLWMEVTCPCCRGEWWDEDEMYDDDTMTEGEIYVMSEWLRESDTAATSASSAASLGTGERSDMDDDADGDTDRDTGADTDADGETDTDTDENTDTDTNADGDTETDLDLEVVDDSRSGPIQSIDSPALLVIEILRVGGQHSRTTWLLGVQDEDIFGALFE